MQVAAAEVVADATAERRPHSCKPKKRAPPQTPQAPQQLTQSSLPSPPDTRPSATAEGGEEEGQDVDDDTTKSVTSERGPSPSPTRLISLERALELSPLPK
jgi:hypothetical protein